MYVYISRKIGNILFQIDFCILNVYNRTLYRLWCVFVWPSIYGQVLTVGNNVY